MIVTEPDKAMLKDTGEFIIVGDPENDVLPIARMTLGVAKHLAMKIMEQVNAYESITHQKVLAPQEVSLMYKENADAAKKQKEASKNEACVALARKQ